MTERDLDDGVVARARNAGDASPAPPRFAKITMSPALAALPGSALKVCLALASYCSPQKPHAWPKQARLAETLGISEQKVRAWLEVAREAGAVTWTRRPYARATCSYDLSSFWAMAEGTAWPQRAPRTTETKVKQRDASGRFANAQTAGKAGGSKRRETRRSRAPEKSAVSSEGLSSVRDHLEKRNPDPKDQAAAAAKTAGTSTDPRTREDQQPDRPDVQDMCPFPDGRPEDAQGETRSVLPDTRAADAEWQLRGEGLRPRDARQCVKLHPDWFRDDWSFALTRFRDWVAKEGITPRKPIALFVAFLRQHQPECEWKARHSRGDYPKGRRSRGPAFAERAAIPPRRPETVSAATDGPLPSHSVPPREAREEAERPRQAPARAQQVTPARQEREERDRQEHAALQPLAEQQVLEMLRAGRGLQDRCVAQLVANYGLDGEALLERARTTRGTPHAEHTTGAEADTVQ